jgi:hypothetical protein
VTNKSSGEAAFYKSLTLSGFYPAKRWSDVVAFDEIPTASGFHGAQRPSGEAAFYKILTLSGFYPAKRGKQCER